MATFPSNVNGRANPTCTVPGMTSVTGSTAVTVTATISTTGGTSAALAYPKTNRWYTAAGGAALACMLFFGIPARRRSWKSMLCLLVFLVGMAGIGCGGGGGIGSGTNPSAPGATTPGTYTFQITGTDSTTSTITTNTTFTVVVN